LSLERANPSWQALLPGELAEVTTLCLNSCGYRFFLGVIPTDGDLLPVRSDVGTPLPPPNVPPHTLIARGIASGGWQVLAVVGMVREPQVGSTAIQSIAVNMVDLFAWGCAHDDSVKQIGFTVTTAQ